MNTKRSIEDLLPLDEKMGPARRITRDRAQSMIEAAIDQSERDHSETRRPRTSRNKTAFYVRTLLVAALILALGATAIAFWVSSEAPDDDRRSESDQQVSEKRETEGPRILFEQVEATEVSENIDQISKAQSFEKQLKTESPAEPRPRTKAETRPLKIKQRQAPSTQDTTSPDLLKQANALRAKGRFSQASELYSKVAREFPGTDEAYVASVASASLHVDHLGQTGSARKLYRSALRMRPTGYLSEEARFGLAQCERAANRREAEIRALREFIQFHPHSPLRARAQARLEELDRARLNENGSEN